MGSRIATQIVGHIQKKRVTLQVLSWREHSAQGHSPFRDCGVCQRAAARQRPHQAQGIPQPCALALDLSGPFKAGRDIDGEEKKYLLVGSYPWPVYEGHELRAELLTAKGLLYVWCLYMVCHGVDCVSHSSLAVEA